MFNDGLPEWEEIENRVNRGEDIDPVDRFIHDNEPVNEEDAREFRRTFKLALDYVR